MRRWRFALERRWFGYLAMAIVFAIACFFLSRWQFTRNNETIVAKNLLDYSYAARAVPLAELLPAKTSYTADDAWRRVTLEGRYESHGQLLVRDRTYGGYPGFEVLTPFRLTDGSVFVVDRGWVSVGTTQDAPDSVPAPPAGLVHVTARLQASETVLPGRVDPRGEIPEINLPTVEKLTGIKVYTGAYGLLMSETPAPPTRPAKAVKPTIDNGPYLSYAFQWILFALLAFGGLGWALRQEYRVRNADDPVEQTRAVARAEKARNRAPGDAEIEDAQIEDARIAGRGKPPSPKPGPAARAAATRQGQGTETSAAENPDDAQPDATAVDEPQDHPILYLN